MINSSIERAGAPEHDDRRDDTPGDGNGHLHDVAQPSHGDLRQRALYVVARGRRVVVARVFVKKTRRTPRREIELALRRAGEVEQ